MIQDKSADFDIAALYEAIDSQRQSHGMTWAQVARAINGVFEHEPVRPISAFTLNRMPARTVLEADGVLQILRWLGRTPESFASGHNGASDGEKLPSIRTEQILRLDTKTLYWAVDARRIEKRMTWEQVANEIGGVSASSLTRLAKGGRTTFPQVMRMTKWLNRSVASFTHGCDH
jgi:hypothetical protein